MSLNLSGYHFGNIGLTPNSSGGLSANSLSLPRATNPPPAPTKSLPNTGNMGGGNMTDSTGMQIGGWYNNPAQGNKNMRYWGNGTWTTGADPTQSASSSSPDTGGTTVAVNAPTVSASDITSLENQVYNQLKPYYTQLLTEANGDMNRAIALLQQDYTTGVRQAKQTQAVGAAQELSTLQNTMGSLGLTFTGEQLDQLDKLNQRGAAVYQQGPGQSPNALSITLPHSPDLNPASANTANFDPTNPNSLYYNPDNSGTQPLQTLPNGVNLGEGGVELQRTLQDQQLRQEAAQRASNNKLQTLGVNLVNYTNPQGQNFSTKAGTKAAANNTSVNPNFYGTAEQNLLSGTAQDVRNNQTTAEGLYNQLQQQTFNNASALAGLGVKEAGNTLTNFANTQQQQNFVNSGAGTNTAT